MRHPRPDPVGPGQESVWDYPRPPVAAPTDERVVVLVAGAVVADSRRAVRVLETSHPPVYYVPRQDVVADHVRPVSRRTVCEWKGEATYLDIVVGSEVRRSAAWTYPDPAPGFDALRGAIAFYPQAVDGAWVDGERVRAGEGDFYGGWITSRIVGPFKGGPGTMWW